MWQITPEEAQAAETLIGGWLGAIINSLFQKDQSVSSRAVAVVSSMGVAWFFAPVLDRWLGIGSGACAVIVGLVCLVLAKRLLLAAQKFDAFEVFKAIMGARK